MLFFSWLASLPLILNKNCVGITDANLNLGLGSGILIAVPIPKDHSASGYTIESAIQKALEEAKYSLPIFIHAQQIHYIFHV